MIPPAVDIQGGGSAGRLELGQDVSCGEREFARGLGRPG